MEGFPWSTLIWVGALVVLEAVAMIVFKGSYVIMTVRGLLDVLFGALEEVVSDESRKKQCGALVMFVFVVGAALLCYLLTSAMTGQLVVGKVAFCVLVLLALNPVARFASDRNRKWVVQG